MYKVSLQVQHEMWSPRDVRIS